MNPHIHATVTDGLFIPTDACDPDSPLAIIELPSPSDIDIDIDIEELLHDIAVRVLAIARRFRLPELTLRMLERELGARLGPTGPRGADEDDTDGENAHDDGLWDLPSEDEPGSDDSEQALLAQTLAHALRPPLSPEPSSRRRWELQR